MPSILYCLLSLSSSFTSPGTDTLAPNSLLYNGPVYAKQFTVDMGSPFFPAENNQGDILYQGNWYRGLLFYYDCEDQVLIITLRDGQQLQLVPEKTDAFVLDNHSFIKLPIPGATEEFYELLYNGQRQLLVKWQKRVIKNMQEQSIYVLSKKLMLAEGSMLNEVDQLSDIMDLYPTQKKVLRQVYRDNRLSFRKDPLRTAFVLIMAAEGK